MEELCNPRSPWESKSSLEVSVVTGSNLENELGLRWAEADVVGRSALARPDGTGVEVTYLQTQDEPIFVVFHRPSGRPIGIILVCSPPFAEAARNHQRELLLGWLASEAGFVVARFHPRGLGQSGGDTLNVTLETIEEDAGLVIAEALRRYDQPLVGLLGTRLGAVIANRLAAAWPMAPVAWWSPVLKAESYWRELLRASLIGSIKQGRSVSTNELKNELASQGVLDVLGSGVSKSFFETLFKSPLDDAPEGPRRGLLVQMSRHVDLQRPYDLFLERLLEIGWVVQTMQIPEEEAWWFGARGREAELQLRVRGLQVVPATVNFFAESSAAGAFI
jgi:alpha/beta superfamily hydrolase